MPDPDEVDFCLILRHLLFTRATGRGSLHRISRLELAQLLHKEPEAFLGAGMTAEDQIPWRTYPW